MHPFVSLNGRRLPKGDAQVSAVSAAVFYGRGVFTTIAIVGGEPFLWPKHLKRLTDHAGRLAVKFEGNDSAMLERSMHEVIEANEVVDGRVRITLFGCSGGLWQNAGERESSLLVMSAARRPAPQRLKLGLSPYPINSSSPLAGIKSCNYLENLLAMDEAKAGGFDESIRINERGEVVSACMANLFWVSGAKVFTPPASSGCLMGTTREYVLENFAVVEKAAEVDEVSKADAVFLTSAGLGVKQVCQIENRFLEPSDHRLASFLDLK